MGRSETERNPAAEGVPNDHRRDVELFEQSGDRVCITLGADGLTRWRGGPKTRKIGRNGRKSAEALGKIVPTAPPPMQREDPGRWRSVNLSEEFAVKIRAKRHEESSIDTG
jgi:hypothetical protein